MNAKSATAVANSSFDPHSVLVGQRDAKFWPDIKRYAHQANSYDDLLSHGREINGMMPIPLTDAEVVAKCKHWWRKTERGENKWGIGQFTTVDHALIDDLMMRDIDAFTLLILLRRLHWGHDFYLANGMCESMPDGGWRRQRFTAARTLLIERGYLIVVRPASRRPPKPMLLRLSRNGHQ